MKGILGDHYIIEAIYHDHDDYETLTYVGSPNLCCKEYGSTDRHMPSRGTRLIFSSRKVKLR